MFSNGVAQVDSVLPGTPAETVGIIPGDHVISVDGDRVDSASELQERIFTARPGSRPTLLVERNGDLRTLRPVLVAWPTIQY
ncbi:MAG: PDZ domain-containing protein [Deltaproteobacteria bacterium]|nr:PDZ domain-containing protein [Deltaproteobacteria bacterium]